MFKFVALFALLFVVTFAEPEAKPVLPIASLTHYGYGYPYSYGAYPYSYGAYPYSYGHYAYPYGYGYPYAGLLH